MVVGGRGGGWLGMKQNELIPRVLGIPRNSNLFQDIQMRKHKKVWNIWEYLRIDENTSGNFSEFLGIPNHWKFGIYGNYWKLQKHTGHVPDLVLPGEGIFESFFAQDWDIWLPTQMKRTDTEHMFPASTLHACTIQFATIWKSWRPVRTSKSWVDFAVLSSNFVCFSMFLINWTF